MWLLRTTVYDNNKSYHKEIYGGFPFIPDLAVEKVCSRAWRLQWVGANNENFFFSHLVAKLLFIPDFEQIEIDEKKVNLFDNQIRNKRESPVYFFMI